MRDLTDDAEVHEIEDLFPRKPRNSTSTKSSAAVSGTNKWKGKVMLRVSAEKRKQPPTNDEEMPVS
jgi:hypothetical protein